MTRHTTAEESRTHEPSPEPGEGAGTDRASDPPDADSGDASFHRCDRCSRAWYYDRAVCPDCGARSFTRIRPGEGTVAALTTVHVTPEGVPQPLELGLASFPTGGHVVAQLADDRLERGDGVVLRGPDELRRAADGTTITGSKLYPAAAGDATDASDGRR